MEPLTHAPADCEVRSVIKFLKANNIAPIAIHRQLCYQSFPADFLVLVEQKYHGAPVVMKIVRQVGAKATDTRTQRKAQEVNIDIFAAVPVSGDEFLDRFITGAKSYVHGVLGQTGHSPRRLPDQR